MPSSSLQFATIDLARHRELCIEFRRDSYIVSFGDDQLFNEENGLDGSGYIEWLADRIARFPEGHVHAWRGAEIIGQIEMIVSPSSGYVNLFYLKPEERGSGYGKLLHEYAVDLFQRHRVRVAGLSVSPTNRRALSYYARHGWKDLGPRAGAAHVHDMALFVPSSGREQRDAG
jgi:GNAT superfamily N-acetyltransferase